MSTLSTATPKLPKTPTVSNPQVLLAGLSDEEIQDNWSELAAKLRHVPEARSSYSAS